MEDQTSAVTYSVVAVATLCYLWRWLRPNKYQVSTTDAGKSQKDTELVLYSVRGHSGDGANRTNTELLGSISIHAKWDRDRSGGLPEGTHRFHYRRLLSLMSYFTVQGESIQGRYLQSLDGCRVWT